MKLHEEAKKQFSGDKENTQKNSHIIKFCPAMGR
jgi:hypothetical protein